MIRDIHDNLLASTLFPVSHGGWPGQPTPLERVDKEVKRRTDIGGVFHQACSAAALVEAHYADYRRRAQFFGAPMAQPGKKPDDRNKEVEARTHDGMIESTAPEDIEESSTQWASLHG